MSKLIYALSKAGLELAYGPTSSYAKLMTAADNPIYNSVAFTSDGYLYTHGQYFRIFGDATNIFTSTVTNGIATLKDGNNTTLGTINVGVTNVIGGNVLSNTVLSNGSITINHDTSSLVASTLGATGNSSSTIKVPKIITDSYGHLITGTTEYTATLNNVLINANITTAAEYKVLLGTTSSIAETISLNKASKLTFNPSTGALTATKFIGTLNKKIDITLNGTLSTFNNVADIALSFYAPSTSGSSGNILISNGSGASPSWLGLSTVINGSSTNSQVPTALAVYNAIGSGIAAQDAMVYKGTIGTGGTYTIANFNALATYSIGWTFRVIEAGTIKGVVCEIGDLVTALVTRTGSGNVNSDWTVGQTNIDGAVTTSATLTANQIIIGGGGKVVNALSAGSAGNVLTMTGGNPIWAAPILNTAGSTNLAATKLFLIGATTQGANPTTNSNSGVYIGVDNKLYSNNAVVLTNISTYVQNNLTYSTNDATYALSAYQGYVLNRNDITAAAVSATTLTLTRASGNITTSIPTWNQNTTGTAKYATNLAGGTIGAIPWQSGAGTTLFIAAGTNGQVLKYRTDTNRPYWASDTDTHWTANLYVGATSGATANAAATNGNVYLNLVENSTVRNSHNISGTNATTVTSDASGNIIINSVNSWRNVFAYAITSPTTPSEILSSSIATNDLQFGSEFLWDDTNLELKLGWAIVDGAGNITYSL